MAENEFDMVQEDKPNKGFFMGFLRRFTNKNTSVDNGQYIHAENVLGSVYQAGGDIININADKETLDKILKISSQGNGAIVPLLEEKANECKGALLRNDLEKVRKICEALCISTYEGCPDHLRSKFKYYRYLLSVMADETREIQEQCKAVLSDDYAGRSEYVSEIYKDAGKCDVNKLFTLEEEDQICALTILFKNGYSESILDAFDSLTDEAKGAIPFFWQYFVGLSMFNAQRFEESAVALRKLVEQRYYSGLTKQDSIVIYSFLAELQDVTRKLSQGYGAKEELIELYKKYTEQKEKCDFDRAISGQEKLAAEVELQTVLNINCDDFWEVYNSYPSEIKSDPQVLNLLGTYYEIKGDYQNVYDIYSQLDWKHEDLFLFKLLYSKFVSREFDAIIQLYDEADASARTARVQGLRLSAIRELYPDKFEEDFKVLIDGTGDDYEDIFALTLSIKIEDRLLFERLVYPKVKALIDNIAGAPDNVKVGYAGIFVQYAHGEDALKMLKSIEHPNIIDDQLGMEFYRNLYFYEECDSMEADVQDPNKAKFYMTSDETIKETLADWFIEKDIVTANFLTIKINCLYDRGKVLNAIEKSKELYEITKDSSVAANIISLLTQVRTSSKEDYEKYAYILKDSDDLRCLMASAVAYEELGRYDEAGFQSYKALYKLNGSDDYEVFDSCFGLYNRMMAYHNGDAPEKDRVDGNVVITLKEVLEIDVTGGIFSDGNSMLSICLDSEEYIVDYGDGRNKSFGIEHFGPRDSLYLWLHGKKVGDQVIYNGKKYGIVEIVDRYFYMNRYIFSKIVESDGKSKIPVKKIQTDNIEKMKDELFKYLQSEDNIKSRNGKKNLIDMYHHRTSDMGIPIESINSCDYSEYIEVIRELLYLKDQALYAGEASVYDGYSGDYVLTLPSLALICVLSHGEIFDGFKARLMIPISLKTFIQKQINENTDTQLISPGKLITTDDGSMMMLQKDEDVIDIWRRMYEFCEDIETLPVSDEDRSSFELLVGVDAEKFFSKMKYDMCQLDAIILAKKKSAVLIMDDLFFRRLAEYTGIHTTNFAFRLLTQDNDNTYKIAEELSMTNYILTPLLYKDRESGVRFWNNLLNGEIKRMVYGQQLRFLYEQTRKINEMYGNGNDIGMATVVETMD